MSRTLPPTDALTLACSVLADMERPGELLVSRGDQEIHVHWTAVPERTVESAILGRDIPVPAQWCTSAHVEVFVLAGVR
jgi:hypothetical protein